MRQLLDKMPKEGETRIKEIYVQKDFYSILFGAFIHHWQLLIVMNQVK